MYIPFRIKQFYYLRILRLTKPLLTLANYQCCVIQLCMTSKTVSERSTKRANWTWMTSNCGSSTAAQWVLHGRNDINFLPMLLVITKIIRLHFLVHITDWYFSFPGKLYHLENARKWLHVGRDFVSWSSKTRQTYSAGQSISSMVALRPKCKFQLWTISWLCSHHSHTIWKVATVDPSSSLAVSGRVPTEVWYPPRRYNAVLIHHKRTLFAVFKSGNQRDDPSIAV